jgi:hypothetical protein
MITLNQKVIVLVAISAFALGFILTCAFRIYQTPGMIYLLENFRLCG